jgi:hypothetical protein
MKASRPALGLWISFFLLAFLSLPLAVAEIGDHLYLDVGGGWELGYEDETEQAFILEFVRPGETVDNWSELLTVQGFATSGRRYRVSLRAAVDAMEERISARCRNTVWRILNEKPDRVVYYWRIFRCKGEEDQAEIAAYIAGDSTLFRVGYTSKTAYGLTSGERARWQDVFLEAEVIPVQ